ncbi:MAG TPA: DUF2264 domain-containing protein [Capsulimonadaceae bacterium]|jgi:hypothetical protein
MTCTGTDDREYWVSIATKLAEPVLTALAERRLRTTMPVESKHGDADRADRAHCTHLEALGRLVVGIAPWLELGGEDSPEGAARERYAKLAREAIDAATDPSSPDRLNFGVRAPGMSDGARNQAVVDAAFLAQAIVRAPVELWEKLPDRVKANLIAALAESRAITPGPNNWLLFSASIEAAFAVMGQPWDGMRVAYALRQHEAYYVGDGAYSDGPQFHWDYYNSFVIHPMILDILRAVDPTGLGAYGIQYGTALDRARRFAAVLERFISPEGTIPPIGRSLTYRMGALQLLGQVSLLHELPGAVSPASVRCALTAVMRRLMDAPGTFDDRGWLRIGFHGAQPALGEPYISTGSLYLCAAGLLPLGLPANDPFWADAATPWTAQRIYAGDDLPADHAL